MQYCKKCGDKIPYRAKIDGVSKSLRNRTYCLKCSPYGVHNTKDLCKETDRECICTVCGRTYMYSRKMGHTLTKCNSCMQSERFDKMKDKAVEYKGGKCQICGYNRCNRALEFHHVDPEEKDFTISQKYNLSWEKIKEELDKCILVCSNCHAEIEAGIIDACVPQMV